MGLPSDALLYAAQRKVTGIALSVAPSTDQSFDTEVWSRTSSQSSALLRTITGLSGNSDVVSFVHRLPLDGRKRFYKFRTVGPGHWPSAFSTEVTAKPTLLSPSVVATPVTGRGIAAPLLFANASVGSTSVPDAAAGYGTAAVRISLAKQQPLAALNFLPTTTAAGLGTFDNFGRFTNGKADSTSYVFQGRAFIPTGCTVVGLDSGLYRSAAGASAQAILYSIGLGPSRTALVTNTASGTGGWQAPGGTCSHLVGLGEWLLIEVTINDGGVASQSGFADQVVLYTTPTDQNTY